MSILLKVISISILLLIRNTPLKVLPLILSLTEREDAFEKRREGLLESIYKIANGVFEFSNIPLSRKSLYKLSLVCYFDSKTKDYVGVYFLFNTEVKSYITLQKLNLLENKLLQANINTGRTKLLEPNAKYFTKEIDIRIGR